MHQPLKTLAQTQILNWFKLMNPRWRAINTKPTEVLYGNGDHFRCLHIVQADYTSQKEFANLTYRINLHRAFWLVFVNTSLENYFQHSNLPFSLVMLAARIVNNSQAEIYEIHRADPTHPVRINFLTNWTQISGFRVNQKYVYLRRSDLEGTTLRIGIIQNWPISFKIGKNKWGGFYPALWQHIEQVTNMTSIIIQSETTGSKRPNHEWSGLIGMALQGKIDAIVSELTLDASRISVLDFTQPLLKARYQIYFKQPGYVLEWGAVFKPFPAALWRAILLWVFIASLAFYIFQTILKKFKMEPFTMDLSNCVFFTLQSLSQQGRDKVPRSLGCRILFFTCYLVSAVVIPAYSASLISSLTQKTPIRPFNSISEMIKDGTYKLLVPNNTAEYDIFANSHDPEITQAYTKHVQTVPQQHKMTTVRDAVKTICEQHHYALFGVDATLSRKIFQSPGPTCDIIPMAKHLGTVHLGMALPNKHPLHPFIKYQIRLMIERGLLNRIATTTWPVLNKRIKASWAEVHFEEVFQIFVFLGCSIVLSFLFLVFEIISHKTYLKRQAFVF